MRHLLSVAVFVGSVFVGGAAIAQDGCRATNLSCSGLYANCEKVCQNLPNPARCVAASCDRNMPECQSSGMWKSRNGSVACWRTSKKT